MTDKLKTYEFRCRNIIRAASREDAEVALEKAYIVFVLYTRRGTDPPSVGAWEKLKNIELLGEVEGE